MGNKGEDLEEGKYLCGMKRFFVEQQRLFQCNGPLCDINDELIIDVWQTARLCLTLLSLASPLSSPFPFFSCSPL